MEIRIYSILTPEALEAPQPLQAKPEEKPKTLGYLNCFIKQITAMPVKLILSEFPDFRKESMKA